MQVGFLGQPAFPQLSNTLSPWSPSDRAMHYAQGDLNYTWDGKKKKKKKNQTVCTDPSHFPVLN